MTYLFKNIKQLLRKRFCSSICLILGFIITFTIFLFVYGVLYQVSENKLAQVNAVDHFELEIENDADITWERMQKVYSKLNVNTLSGISLVTMHACIGTEFEDYFDTFCFDYALTNEGKTEYVDMGAMIQGDIYKGRWYTKEEFDHASKVAIGSAYEYVDMKDQEKYTKKYEDGSDDVYRINGDKYKRVGVAFFWTTPVIPVTCLEPDAQVTNLYFTFKNDSITTSQYNDLKSAFSQEFGSKVKVPDLKIEDLDINYYYLVFGTMLAIGVVCLCVLSLLICYLFENQKDMIRSYNVCGVKKGQIYLSLTGEIIFLLTIGMFAVLPVYFTWIVPSISELMGYFMGAYTWKTVLILMLGYEIVGWGISMIIAEREIKWFIRN